MSDAISIAIILGVIITFSVSTLVDVVWDYIMRKKALEESDKEVFRK